MGPQTTQSRQEQPLSSKAKNSQPQPFPGLANPHPSPPLRLAPWVVFPIGTNIPVGVSPA